MTVAPVPNIDELRKLRADPSLSNADIAQRLGISERRMEECVRWFNLPPRQRGPFFAATLPSSTPGAVCRVSWPEAKTEELMSALDETPRPSYRTLAKRFGCTKNAICGAVYRERERLGISPQMAQPSIARNPFPEPGSCLFPHGHPDDEDFYFCGAPVFPGKPYCAEHAALTYLRPKEKAATLAKWENAA